MEPERLQLTLAEPIDASAMLPDEDEAAQAALDDPTVPADTGNPPLRERLNEFRKRLVIEDAPPPLVATEEPLTDSNRGLR